MLLPVPACDVIRIEIGFRGQFKVSDKGRKMGQLKQGKGGDLVCEAYWVAVGLLVIQQIFTVYF